MKRNPLFDRIKKLRAKYIDIYIDNSFELSHRIQYLMDEKGMDQKTLAKTLGKNESEISKWMSGSHNFTLKTLAKIEEVLEGKLLTVCDENSNSSEREVIVLYSDFYRTPDCVMVNDGMTGYDISKPTQIKVLVN